MRMFQAPFSFKGTIDKLEFRISFLIYLVAFIGLNFTTLKEGTNLSYKIGELTPNVVLGIISPPVGVASSIRTAYGKKMIKFYSESRERFETPSIEEVKRLANESIRILIALFIPILWFISVQGAKRSHDIGKSGWLNLIPFYCVYLLFRKPQKKTAPTELD